MAIDVFCDESGRSGGNLFDDQEWFALAAHDYTDAEAAAILPELRQAREWKWTALRNNLRIAKETLSNPALQRARISVFVAQKPYMAWLKLYEDLYGDPLNTRVLTRRVHADRLWTVLGAHEAMPAVLDAYVHSVRTEADEALLSLDGALGRLSAPQLLSPANKSKARRRVKSHAALVPLIATMRANVPLLSSRTPSSRAERGARLDPHIAALGIVFSKWAPQSMPVWARQQRTSGWVRVHHDRLDAMPTSWVEFLRLLPGIESFDFVESKGSPAIQLADILAGAAATAANPLPPTRADAQPMWRWLREEAIDARFIWEVSVHPSHHDRYPLVLC